MSCSSHVMSRRRGRALTRKQLLEPLEDRSLLAQTTVSWVGGNRSWSNLLNWSPPTIPTNVAGTTYSVLIDNANAANSSVSLDISATIDSLTIDSADSLTLNNNVSLTIVNSGAGTGTINNKGN